MLTKNYKNIFKALVQIKKKEIAVQKAKRNNNNNNNMNNHIITNSANLQNHKLLV